MKHFNVQPYPMMGGRSSNNLGNTLISNSASSLKLKLSFVLWACSSLSLSLPNTTFLVSRVILHTTLKWFICCRQSSVSLDKKAFRVRAGNKTQLLVNMPKECTEIAADAMLIYWPRARDHFILNDTARQQFIFILFLSGL